MKYQVVTALAEPPPDVLATLMEGWGVAERARFLSELSSRRRESVRTLRESGLWKQMGPDEQAFMTAAPDAISEQALLDVSWLMESAECLLWALGYSDTLPPYDTQADVGDLNRLPAGSIQELQSKAVLRPPEVIARARELAELWHWRSRTRRLIESGAPVGLPDGLTLMQVVKLAAEKAASEGAIAATIEDDFPLFGKGYARMSAEEWSQATSIVMERHRALNWLCGYAPRNRWEDTPVDT